MLNAEIAVIGSPWNVLTLACICLFIGAMGKSAQVPLHVWLPDSMEGPTPISALIHAATMVTAGVFLVARMSPLFEYSEAALTFVLVIGGRFAGWRTSAGRVARRRRELELTDTPNNRGKLGLLELKQGRLKRAIEHLEIAFDGQPDVGDWAFGLGLAYLETGNHQRAGELFARVVVDDPNLGFGQPFLGLANSAIGVGRPQDALEPLAEFEQRFGKAPEASYWRGLALKKLGRKEDAAAAFREVGALASELPGFQRGRKFRMKWRAFWARSF